MIHPRVSDSLKERGVGAVRAYNRELTFFGGTMQLSEGTSMESDI